MDSTADSLQLHRLTAVPALLGRPVLTAHTLDISVKKKQVTSQKRSQHSQQNYHKNLGLRKTLHPPKSTRLKLP